MPPRRRSFAVAWVLVLLAGWALRPGASLAARGGVDAAPTAVEPASPRGLVIVLRPPELTETMRVVLARITGELAAASFQVRTDALDLQQDPTHQIQAVALEANAVAAFALGGSRDSLAIWIFERLGHRTTVQRVPVRPGGFPQDAKVSALKAVELIRASLSDLWPAPTPTPSPAAAPPPASPPLASSPPSPPPSTPAGPPSPPPSPPVARTVPSSPSSPPIAAAPLAPTNPPPFPPPPNTEPPAAPIIESSAPPPRPTDTTWPPSPGLAVGLGVAALWDLRATPQWMGSLHVEGRFHPRIALQARVAGLGPSLTIPAGDSNASIERERGSLGASWSFWSGARGYLALAAALGTERIRGSGSTTTRDRPVYTATAWTPIALVGLSATARLARHWSASVRVETEWAWSRVELTIGDWRTVPLARPGVLSEISLQAVF